MLKSAPGGAEARGLTINSTRGIRGRVGRKGVDFSYVSAEVDVGFFPYDACQLQYRVERYRRNGNSFSGRP